MWRLCDAFPVLGPIRDEHHREEFREFLLYAFMGDVSRRLFDLFEAANRGGVAEREELSRVLEFFEFEYAQGVEGVKEVIDLGLLENLAGPPEPH